MNSITLRLAALFFFSTLPASPVIATESNSTEDYLSLLRVDLRARKAQVVMESMELTVDEAKKFMPIYSGYDEELSKLNAQRINTIRDFAANFSSLDAAKARELMKASFSNTRKRLDLLEKAAGKVEKALTPLAGARFAQIENQLLLMIDVQIAAELPLIPRAVISPPVKK